MRRYWFGRFEVKALANGDFLFRDWLQPAARLVGSEVFEGLFERSLEVAFFQRGFVRAAVSSYGVPVAQRHRVDSPDESGVKSSLFWQFPCRTEAAAWDAHASISQPALVADAMHVYLGLPWATWIDKARKLAWGSMGETEMYYQLCLIGVQLSGLRHALAQLGVRLQVHTVCQHIYWADLVPAWRNLGVTDLWLSHCPLPGSTSMLNPQVPLPDLGAICLHPWALYAVNVEDPARRAGLVIGNDPANRSVLASFVGAHMSHYLSDVRLRLKAFADTPGFVVRVTGGWHFESVVYQHQIQGEPLAHDATLDDEVVGYNRLLSDSVFALCPAGAGANTLRLWEALAVGAIPVLLGDQPLMPNGGSLSPIDWDAIVVRVPTEQMDHLPQLLGNMPLSERRARQRLGLKAYEAVRVQRCY